MDSTQNIPGTTAKWSDLGVDPNQAKVKKEGGQTVITVTLKDQDGAITKTQRMVIQSLGVDAQGEPLYAVRAGAPVLVGPNNDLLQRLDNAQIAEARAAWAENGSVGRFGMTLGDVVLALTKMLSEMKFDDTMMSAELGVMTVELADEQRNMRVEAKKLDVEAAKMALTGAIVGAAMAGASFAMSVGSAVKTKVAERSKMKDADADMDAATQTYKDKNPGKDLPKSGLTAAQGQKLEQLETQQSNFDQGKLAQPAGKTGVGANQGEVNAVAGGRAQDLSAQQKHDMKEMQDIKDFDAARVKHGQVKGAINQELGMKAHIESNMAQQFGQIGGSISQAITQSGIIMFAVPAEELRGMADVSAAAGRLMNKLMESLTSDSKDTNDLFRDIQKMLTEWLEMNTQNAKF